ncbi:MAG: acyloxyacyl hydrolase [Chitinophagaceae bacterium]
MTYSNGAARTVGNFCTRQIQVMKQWVLLFYLGLLSLGCRAQYDKTNDWVLALDGQYGFVWVHTAKVESVRGAHPTSATLSLTKAYADANTYQQWHLFARQGLQLTYTDFKKEVLGKAYILAYKLQPIVPLSEHLNLTFTGNIGAAYLTNPYNANTNPNNQSYSSKLNAYLRLAAGLEYNVGNHLGVNLSADYNHLSNGGSKQPNRGINYPTASLGLLYHTQSNRLPQYDYEKDDSWKDDNNIKTDFSLFFSPKDGYAKISDPSQSWNSAAWKPQRKPLFGGNVQVSKQVSGINALNVGAEAYYDGAMASIKENRGHQSSNVLVGILAGNEFIINRFLFSQQLGWYLYKNTKYLDTTYYNQSGRSSPYKTPLYQRYGLRYRFLDNWYAGFNLLAHGKTADFFDIRLTYRLGNKR